MALAVLLVGLAVVVLTQTAWGRERVLALTLRTLSPSVQGTLVIDRLEGNLLAGARVYGLSLRGEDGQPFITADSGYVDYELPSLIGGDMLLNRVDLYDAEIAIHRLPGDTLWNYQQIFPDTSDQPGGRATLVDAAHLANAHVFVRTPWEPDTALAAAERERALDEALADTSRLMVEEVPGGYLRTMRFQVEEAKISGLVSAPEDRGGLFLRVDGLATLAYVYRDPIPIEQLEGELALREGIVQFRAGSVRLPESRLAVFGTVDLTGDEPRYDLVVEGEQIALPDLQWLFPPLPEEGGGQLRLTLETRPDGLLYRVQDLRLETPDTEITGSLGVIVGDRTRVLNADLQADPLDLGAVESLFPASFPVERLRIGAAAVEEPGS